RGRGLDGHAVEESPHPGRLRSAQPRQQPTSTLHGPVRFHDKIPGQRRPRRRTDPARRGRGSRRRSRHRMEVHGNRGHGGPVGDRFQEHVDTVPARRPQRHGSTTPPSGPPRHSSLFGPLGELVDDLQQTGSTNSRQLGTQPGSTPQVLGKKRTKSEGRLHVVTQRPQRQWIRRRQQFSTPRQIADQLNKPVRTGLRTPPGQYGQSVQRERRLVGRVHRNNVLGLRTPHHSRRSSPQPDPLLPSTPSGPPAPPRPPAQDGASRLRAVPNPVHTTNSSDTTTTAAFVGTPTLTTGTTRSTSPDSGQRTTVPSIPVVSRNAS